MNAISLPAGLALVLACGCAGPRQSASTSKAPRPKTARDLRVMTFNLRVRTILDGPNIWDRRRDFAVERIRAFDPDLLGTQEGLDSMEAFLREKLGDYTFVGAGRGDGKRRGEMSAVFFKTARFALLDSGHFWLSRTPEKPGSRGWGAIFPRMVTWVKLRSRDGGADFCWFNTHFDAFSGRARRESAKLLRDRIGEIAGGLPCVVTGDFNTGPDSEPCRTLLAEQRLHDVFRAANPVTTGEEGTMHLFTGWRCGRRMDWILASSHFHAIDAAIDHTRGSRGYPSDHFPVTAILRKSRPRVQ